MRQRKKIQNSQETEDGVSMSLMDKSILKANAEGINITNVFSRLA